MSLDFRTASLAAALTIAAATASAQTLESSDADLLTAQSLTDLCAAAGGDAGSEKARVFCHGYIAGAMHFHRAMTARGDLVPLACPGDSVTRRQMAAVYVGWSTGRDDLATMTPLEGLARAARDEWPCAQ